MKKQAIGLLLAGTVSSALAAAPAGAQPQPNLLEMMWPFALILVLFYFFLIRPQSKRAKAQRAMLERLSVGDEVMTAGGLVGKVARLRDTFVTIRAGRDVELTVQKSSVSTVLPKGTLDNVLEA
ncbi:MAG: preprotein translocase subunit YajC [Gammaproteobacteria bacterium RIFCSPHIGHO2_12_FULL_45_9]|nr:MAG: preprotein translocase subunit YajC [Gammaproteobacteria bacterium RIFCSPHIGHO2_12_FULL_45_9]